MPPCSRRIQAPKATALTTRPWLLDPEPILKFGLWSRNHRKKFFKNRKSKIFVTLYSIDGISWISWHQHHALRRSPLESKSEIFAEKLAEKNTNSCLEMRPPKSSRRLGSSENKTKQKSIFFFQSESPIEVEMVPPPTQRRKRVTFIFFCPKALFEEKNEKDNFYRRPSFKDRFSRD